MDFHYFNSKMHENTADRILAKEFLIVTAGYREGQLKLSELDADLFIEIISKALKMTEEDFVTLLSDEYLDQKYGGH